MGIRGQAVEFGFEALDCGLGPGVGGFAPGIALFFEVAKMAVDERYRGRGVGRKILAYTIEQARRIGASVLYIETNRKLANAIHLYESLGFQHLPPKESPYARANVFMELRLKHKAITDWRGGRAFKNKNKRYAEALS